MHSIHELAKQVLLLPNLNALNHLFPAIICDQCDGDQTSRFQYRLCYPFLYYCNRSLSTVPIHIPFSLACEYEELQELQANLCEEDLRVLCDSYEKKELRGFLVLALIHHQDLDYRHYPCLRE